MTRPVATSIRQQRLKPLDKRAGNIARQPSQCFDRFDISRHQCRSATNRRSVTAVRNSRSQSGYHLPGGRLLVLGPQSFGFPKLCESLLIESVDQAPSTQRNMTGRSLFGHLGSQFLMGIDEVQRLHLDQVARNHNTARQRIDLVSGFNQRHLAGQHTTVPQHDDVRNHFLGGRTYRRRQDRRPQQRKPDASQPVNGRENSHARGSPETGWRENTGVFPDGSRSTGGR